MLTFMWNQHIGIIMRGVGQNRFSGFTTRKHPVCQSRRADHKMPGTPRVVLARCPSPTLCVSPLPPGSPSWSMWLHPPLLSSCFVIFIACIIIRHTVYFTQLFCFIFDYYHKLQAMVRVKFKVEFFALFIAVFPVSRQCQILNRYSLLNK